MLNQFDTAKAKLTIVSRTLSPEEISRRIGIQYDEARRIGDARGRSGLKWDENIWWLYETWEGNASEQSVSEALGACLGRLRGRLDSAEVNVQRLSKSEYTEIGLYMLSRTIPAIHLGVDIVQFIGRLGATLDVDVVLYGDDNESK
jgi:hypothetical protein